jgi:hypothetical protein
VTSTWEYARVRVRRDPGRATPPGAPAAPLDVARQLPGEDAFSPVDRGQFATLNDMGSQGWELIGPPIVLNAVYGFQSRDGDNHDRASWVEKEFIFKRGASA